MAKKRVEVEEMPNMENIQIVTTTEETLTEIPKKQQVVSDTSQHVQSDKEPINCLRDEQIIVKFVPSATAMIRTKGHLLYGGMSDNATRSFTVPLLSTGQYMNVLTNNEKAYLEQALGLEYNALSVYRKNDNFWDDSNPKGIGRVILHKQDNHFDLRSPIDYIRYKILLANKDTIASSLQELEERPKATYQYVIVSENDEAQMNLSRMDATKRCYMEYGKIENNKETLRVIIELYEKRPLAPKTKLDFLQGKVNDYIQDNPRKFLGIIKDELLPFKVLVRRAVEDGIISMRNDLYYLHKDGMPLCELGEDSTLNNAARYLSRAKHQDLKFSIEAQLKKE